MASNGAQKSQQEENNERVRFAIVGATGLIGHPIAQSVLDMGHDVVAVTRKRTSANENKLSSLEIAGACVFVNVCVYVCHELKVVR